MCVRCPKCQARRRRLYANPEFLFGEYDLPDVCCRCSRRAVRRWLDEAVRNLGGMIAEQVIA